MQQMKYQMKQNYYRMEDSDLVLTYQMMHAIHHFRWKLMSTVNVPSPLDNEQANPSVPVPNLLVAPLRQDD